MAAHVETVVIGGGQAGLAASYFLRLAGREHVVLERNRVAESWRSRRWDSFTLVGPNWTCGLPGRPYDGHDPDGYMGRDELVALFDSYARSFGAPVREGVAADRLSRKAEGGAFVIETNEGPFTARSVVVATGPYQRPKVPDAAAALDPAVHQLHADEYRSAAKLPDGGVLVVGSGQSGCQIAEDLRDAGREVYLSCGGCGWYPRRYRGSDNVRWREEMGFFDKTVDMLPSLANRLAAVPIQTGRGGGHDLNLRTLAAKGVVLAGRFASADRTKVVFERDLDTNLARSDKVARDLIAEIDTFITRGGIRAPRDDTDFFFAPSIEQVDKLDLAERRISTVIWGTGYELDFSWIDLPIFDKHGYPVQRQGVTEESGLYFLGLHWMHTRKSGLIWGIGRDARHVVEHMTGARLSPVAA